MVKFFCLFKFLRLKLYTIREIITENVQSNNHLKLLYKKKNDLYARDTISEIPLAARNGCRDGVDTLVSTTLQI